MGRDAIDYFRVAFLVLWLGVRDQKIGNDVSWSKTSLDNVFRVD